MRRLEIISDLHFMIRKKFREHGIVIAFPQRDVHFYPAADVQPKGRLKSLPLFGIAQSSSALRKQRHVESRSPKSRARAKEKDGARTMRKR